MSWFAATDQKGLQQNTILGIYEKPSTPDGPIRLPPSGTTISVRFRSNGAPTNVTLIEVTASNAVIQTSNQTKWRMTRMAPKEVAPPPETEGRTASYWRVEAPQRD
jgi:hypothetical protein